MNKTDLIDTVIIGGNLPGLSAALILGRCTRKVLVFDDGNYRNYAVSHVNGFITQDNVSPEELRTRARKDLEKYDIKIINSHVHNIRREENYFIIEYEAYTVKAKTVILATGLKDQLPEIEGLKEAYGKRIFHCIYCDGYENKDKKLAVHGKNGADLCLMLRTWTKDLTWFSEEEPSKEDRKKLENKGIKIIPEKIQSINMDDVFLLTGIIGDFRLCIYAESDGPALRYKRNNQKVPWLFDGMFLSLTKGQKQKSNLAEKLGLKVTKENGIEVNDKGETEIPALYSVGDCTRDRLLVIIGAAEGVETAINVNKYLRENWDV